MTELSPEVREALGFLKWLRPVGQEQQRVGANGAVTYDLTLSTIESALIRGAEAERKLDQLKGNQEMVNMETAVKAIKEAVALIDLTLTTGHAEDVLSRLAENGFYISKIQPLGQRHPMQGLEGMSDE
jgi:hypothetical protein